MLKISLSYWYKTLTRLFYGNIFEFLMVILMAVTFQSKAQERKLDSSMHYLSNGNKPEWEEFFNKKPINKLVIRFEAEDNVKEYCLQLNQYEVKQKWEVLLNEQSVGSLVADANPMNTYFIIPPHKLHKGENTLTILPSTNAPDDIMVGPITLHTNSLNRQLHEAKINLTIIDKKSGTPMPARITIINNQRMLQTVSAISKDSIAVRPGTIYSSGGHVSVALPAGMYTVFATRGFEYSVDSTSFYVNAGETLEKTLTLRHEVQTKGWVSSDTHIHTYTYSGHGDATTSERALTIAGEGIELPIVTDHNVKVNIASARDSVGVTRYYTPVPGVEYTTNLGHFNIFPVSGITNLPPAKISDWTSVRDLANTNKDAVIILNHARDTHLGFRPFDVTRYIAVAGMSRDGWKFPANAMELVNSGALQTDIFRLYKDWFGMLNRGYFLTPVGASDSHDVSRYLVGQARTYIKANDTDAGKINLPEAVRNFREGKVAVSLGLLANIKVNNKYGAGDLVPLSKQVQVSVEVFGPGWTTASKVFLYANGKKIREAMITNGKSAGLKWKGTWVLPRFSSDVFLVAIAEGPYHYLPYWPLVKPFQPVSPRWTPTVISSTGAIWIDGDGDGVRSSAYLYANKAWNNAKGSIEKLIDLLGFYDESVSVQAASILDQQGIKLEGPHLQGLIQKAKPAVKTGFTNFITERKLLANPVKQAIVK